MGCRHLSWGLSSCPVLCLPSYDWGNTSQPCLLLRPLFLFSAIFLPFRSSLWPPSRVHRGHGYIRFSFYNSWSMECLSYPQFLLLFFFFLKIKTQQTKQKTCLSFACMLCTACLWGPEEGRRTPSVGVPGGMSSCAGAGNQT